MKDQIQSLIRDTFPGINDVEFHVDGWPVQSWVEKSLLPFFFYFNCSPTNRKAISLFLDESSIARKLLPAYLALAFYKNSIKQILDRLNFQTQFPPFTIKVVHKGAVSFVESIDYLHRKICIKNGMGGATHLNFEDAYQLRWTYSGSKHIEKQLTSFIDLKKSETDDFFNFPIDPAKSEFEGALFFTRKGAFFESLKDISINGAPITSGIHIQEVVYNREEDRYEFRSTSSKKAITKKPVAIAVAAQEDIYAFENILKSAGKSLAHIHTIVVEDFDDRVRKAEKDSGAFTDLKTKIKENVLSHFHDGRVRNVFFVNRSHNYSTVQTFWKMHGDDLIPDEWLLTPSNVVEMNSLGNDPIVNIRSINCLHHEQLLLEVERICQEWRSLVAQYFCNGETLKGFLKVHSLSRTLNGIYDPKKVKLDLVAFNTFLDGLATNYFANSADNGLIKRTQQFILSIVALDENQLNHKLREIGAKIADLNTDRIIVIVNSFKPSEDDIQYVTNHLSKIRPGLEFMLFGPKDVLPYTRNTFGLQWFVLTFSEKWKKLPFFTIIGSEIDYLLSRTEFRYAQANTHHLMATLDSIEKKALVSRCLRMELMTPEKRGIKLTIDNSGQTNSTFELDPGEDGNFEQILKSLNQSWKTDERILEDEPKVCVVTDDGTVYTWGESRKIFTYQEGSRSIDESFRYARELREGDKIILLKQDYKQNTNIKKTIEDILGATTEYATTLTNYNEWRWLIEGRIEAMAKDWNRFCLALKAAGFVTTHQTISHWVDGTTTYPHNFKRLLVALADMRIIERSNAAKYLQAVKTVKSLQITFIREALKKLLSDIEGIEYSSENVAINERVINSFIDKIEVKRVENILIESYAN